MLRSGYPRLVLLVALTNILLGLRVVNCGTAPEPGDLRGVGKVTFPITCAAEVQSDFARGVALLHSFFYEEARRVFTSVAERDPNCAMAQWGIAMTWWHPIWTPPTPDEMQAGKAAIEKAMSMKARSDRERGFITALNTYYNTTDSSSPAPVGQSCHGPVGPRDRVVAYENAMQQLHDKYPDDFEVQTFYAFAVLSTGYATPNDTSLSKQLQAAAILEKLWKQNANHPGAVHYLIHSYDYPQFAERGLTAAKTYDSIAPWVPHALHMPSHIFTRLGMWDESIAANRASAEASRAYATMRHRDATEAEELHALDYLAYSYLQEARDSAAKKIVDAAAKVRKTNPELEFSAAYALAAIPTRYAFERNDWAAAANLSIPNVPHWSSFPFMEALIEYGHALGRAHTGDLEGARKAIARMQELRDATKEPKFDYFKSHLDLQMQAASAWVAATEGNKSEAIDMLRRGADSEDKLGKHPVSPGAFVPIREQLGTLLLEMGKPTEAQREFEAALKIYPGRFRGLYGAAQAAEQAGDKEEANRYYTKLAAQTSKAGGSRDELNHVRKFLSAQAKAAGGNGVASVRE
ncbi:MAG TPA: tetratricopeptide repeat protein [Candidatus Udaeobacter sp.]|nr:tetratricopeptide repeat protein [Candidatus Udaeobacter sp.]